jgi:hypothetical protein
MRCRALAALLVACCTSSPAPKAPDALTVDAGVVAEPGALAPAAGATLAAEATPFACGAAADCVTTCGLGAVSRTWLTKHPGGADCEDGCASKGLSADCVGGVCSTMDGGKVDEGCHA